MEWKPIETAPKDGTPILVAHYIHSNDLYGYAPWREINVVIAWWEGGGWEMCFMEDGRADTEGISSQFFQAIRPTHWMPLPSPPSPNPGDGV